MRQDLATTVAFEAVAADFSTVFQAAGLRATLIDACTRDSASPSELRRSLTRQLQATLPKSLPLSVRADASKMPDADFATTEAKVRAAIFEQAHQSPTLRTVIEKDRVGRETFTFYGEKSSWMNAYKAPAMLTKSFDGVSPVKIPVVL